MLTPPVYDRTLTDAKKAARRPETAHLSKGALNPGDLARIEANNTHLAERVSREIGFSPTQHTGMVDSKTLGYASLVNRIATNIEAIRLTAINGVPQRYPEAIPLPGYETLQTDFTGGLGAPTTDYRTINDWERNQAVLDTLITRMVAAFPFSGMCVCGDIGCLPVNVN